MVPGHARCGRCTHYGLLYVFDSAEENYAARLRLSNSLLEHWRVPSALLPLQNDSVNVSLSPPPLPRAAVHALSIETSVTITITSPAAVYHQLTRSWLSTQTFGDVRKWWCAKEDCEEHEADRFTLLYKAFVLWNTEPCGVLLAWTQLNDEDTHRNRVSLAGNRKIHDFKIVAQEDDQIAATQLGSSVPLSRSKNDERGHIMQDVPGANLEAGQANDSGMQCGPSHLTGPREDVVKVLMTSRLPTPTRWEFEAPGDLMISGSKELWMAMNCLDKDHFTITCKRQLMGEDRTCYSLHLTYWYLEKDRNLRERLHLEVVARSEFEEYFSKELYVHRLMVTMMSDREKARREERNARQRERRAEKRRRIQQPSTTSHVTVPTQH